MTLVEENKLREDILSEASTQPILRKLMGCDEIKVANKLVKEGKLSKGVSDDKQKSVNFYI